MSILRRHRKNREVPALDALQAVLLISKYLDTLLPFLLSLRRIPATDGRRVGLLQSIARDIARDPDFARDWYKALELLVGEDLSGRSVADLLLLATKHLGPNGRLGDVWGTAYQIGLIDEALLRRWVMYEGLSLPSGGTGTRNDSTTPFPCHPAGLRRRERLGEK